MTPPGMAYPPEAPFVVACMWAGLAVLWCGASLATLATAWWAWLGSLGL